MASSSAPFPPPSLLRLWLAVPGARPLPKVYAERFGKVDVGDRGGIIVPGARLNAPLEAV